MAGSWSFILTVVFCCLHGSILQSAINPYKTEPIPGKAENGSITVPDVTLMVTLKPPFNITAFLISDTEAFITWAPPEVYPFHDVNTSAIDPSENETYWWMHDSPFANYTVNLDMEGTTMQPDSNVTETSSSNNTDTEVTTTPTTEKTMEEFCHPLTYFLNYTVDYNRTGEAIDGMNGTMPPMIPFHKVFEKLNMTVEGLQNKSVEYQEGCVKEYQVFYYKDANPEDVTMIPVNVTARPEVRLTSLSPDTNYTLFVAAVYISDHMLNSTTFSFKTHQKSEKPTCRCDWHGSMSEDKSYHCSNDSSKPCTCRVGYQGMFCELCAPGYYRTAPYFPCHRCPCSSHATKDRNCRFKEGFLTCSKCEVGYTGNICHLCSYGYYRYHKYCAPCNCNRNHDKSSPYMCDVVTGACFCGYNTTGFSCDRCKEGYEGNPMNATKCRLKAADGGLFKVLPQGVIAGICVGIILVICAIVGCVIYWRWNKNPQQRPFWTVELKDDHEGVNFNTVPNSLDDEIQVVDPKTAMEDQEFYERQGGAAQSRSSGSSGKKYARLHEHI